MSNKIDIFPPEQHEVRKTLPRVKAGQDNPFPLTSLCDPQNATELGKRESATPCRVRRRVGPHAWHEMRGTLDLKPLGSSLEHLPDDLQRVVDGARRQSSSQVIAKLNDANVLARPKSDDVAISGLTQKSEKQLDRALVIGKRPRAQVRFQPAYPGLREYAQRSSAKLPARDGSEYIPENLVDCSARAAVNDAFNESDNIALRKDAAPGLFERIRNSSGKFLVARCETSVQSLIIAPGIN